MCIVIRIGVSLQSFLSPLRDKLLNGTSVTTRHFLSPKPSPWKYQKQTTTPQLNIININIDHSSSQYTGWQPGEPGTWVTEWVTWLREAELTTTPHKNTHTHTHTLYIHPVRPTTLSWNYATYILPQWRYKEASRTWTHNRAFYLWGGMPTERNEPKINTMPNHSKTVRSFSQNPVFQNNTILRKDSSMNFMSDCAILMELPPSLDYWGLRKLLKPRPPQNKEKINSN